MKTQIKPVEVDGYKTSQLEYNLGSNAEHHLHLANANGFPVGCYNELIECFGSRYSCTAVDHKGAWPNYPDPDRAYTTHSFALDLIESLDRLHDKPVIGIGHSHGGVVLAQAAILRPELFKALVIVDGATMPHPWLQPIISRLPLRLVLRLFKFIRSSHERQKNWQTRQQFLTRFESHRTFNTFTTRALQDYAEFGLRPSSSGDFELVFSPAWESHIFRSVGYLWTLLKPLTVPTLLLRAEHSNLYTAQQFAHRNKTLPPHIVPKTIYGGGHLIPFEAPQTVADCVSHWIEQELGTK